MSQTSHSIKPTNGVISHATVPASRPAPPHLAAARLARLCAIALLLALAPGCHWPGIDNHASDSKEYRNK
jgi:hypothetical protein